MVGHIAAMRDLGARGGRICAAPLGRLTALRSRRDRFEWKFYSTGTPSIWC